MARYIDAEMALKIIDNYAKTVTADGIVVVKAIRDIVEIITPTADVVPKSEVESIITLNSQLEANVFEQRKEIERLTVELDAMRGVANSYKMHYAKAMEVPKEVYRLASEIKAELPSARAELAKNVAIEIFAEINKIIDTYGDEYGTMIILDEKEYAALKKKYEVEQ